MELERKKRASAMRKRKKQKRRKFWLVVVLTFLCLIAAAVLIVWKVFTVENVIVEGNERYSDQQIEKFVRSDEYSWNSLYVAFKYRFLDVEEIPFVDSMEVSLDNPHTLRVNVYEKGIIGYLYISAIEQNAYFDTDGFVVETSKEAIENIPQVEGIECDRVVLYEKLPLKDEKVLKALLTATQSLKKNDVVPKQILFDASGEISLRYGGIEVLLGAAENLTQKILRLPYILPEISGKNGTLHLESWTENNSDIVFQEAK